jgi:peptide/nickel transport system permease protein
MTEYVTRRVVQLLPLLLIMSMILYLALDLMPGDPLYSMLTDIPEATPEDYLRLRALYGLDDPNYIRYFKWVWQFIQGRPGYSLQYSMPVMDLIGPRLMNTLLLSLLALFIGKSIAIFIGIYAAVKQYSLFDYASMVLAFIGFCIPGFWLGLVFITTFAVQLQWLPPGGHMDPRTPPELGAQLIDRIRHIILPLTVLVFSETTSTARYMRGSLLDVLRQDYLTTARSKGLAEQAVVMRHALKNALIPVVTVVAVSIPRVVGGTTVIEQVFSYPGMGKLLFDSIQGNDFTVVMSILMLIATLVLTFNLIADVLYGYLDPRIRYS